MKIPTFLGIITLLITASTGFLYFSYYQKQHQQQITQIKNLKVVNLTTTSASITWQTDKPSSGVLNYGLTQSLGQQTKDDRGDKPRLTHLITLKKLSPDTVYYYRILTTDKSKLQQLKTPQKIATDQNLPNLPQFIQGSVVDGSDNPNGDTVVFLNIEGALPQAVSVSAKGNFLFVLKDLIGEKLTNYFDLQTKTSAQLNLTNGLLDSTVQLTFPLMNPILPTLYLGQNIDLKAYTASASAVVNQLDFENQTKLPDKFDLNNDGKINALDLAILLENYRKKGFNKKYDLNGDNKIDQKDVNLFVNTLGSRL